MDTKKTTKEVFSQMANLCSRSEYCSSDIKKKIFNKGLNSDEAESIILKLKEKNFINDTRYIRCYVSDKFKFNRWGRQKISYYLKLKGFNHTLIQKGLSVIDEDKYRSVLLQTMKTKALTIKNKDKFKKIGQLIRFTQNRGFEPELIHRYITEVIE